MFKHRKSPRSLPIEYFTGGEVASLIHDLRRKREKNHKDYNWVQYSDIEDAEGNQYVDLVQEGGGVLGIALLGYTYVLEEFGFRFLSLGGTSAGAINAVLLAAAGKPHEKRTRKLIPLLANKNLFDFVDTEDKQLKAFFKNVLGEKKPNKLKMLWQLMFIFDNVLALKKTRGLNPGKAFERWMQEVLANCGVQNMQDLSDKMQPEPDTLYRRTAEGVKPITKPITPKLAVIATDLTTQTKAEFPAMADLYFKQPMQVNPAVFVRSSMSIPVFFEPYHLTGIPVDPKNQQKWIEKASFRGDIPKEVSFVDGGVVSNFPFDAFHRRGSVPRMPTFGVKLGIDRNKIFDTHKIGQLLNHTFAAARQMNDFAFIQKNREEYEHLVKNIDTDGFNWLNFNISNEKKRALFIKGAKEAADFIEDFHWSTYKDLRGRQLTKM